MPLPRREVVLDANPGMGLSTWCPLAANAWTGLSSLGAAPECDGATRTDDTRTLTSNAVRPMAFIPKPSRAQVGSVCRTAHKATREERLLDQKRPVRATTAPVTSLFRAAGDSVVEQHDFQFADARRVAGDVEADDAVGGHAELDHASNGASG